MHQATSLAPVLLLAGMAAAQPQIFHNGEPVTVHYQLWWMEVSAAAPYAPVANPNGGLDPGEGAKVSIRLRLDPEPGASVTYSPTLLAGSAGAGSLASFWAGSLDLGVQHNGAAASGSWVVNANTTPAGYPDRLGVIPPYAAGFPFANGEPSPMGDRVSNIMPAQFDTGALYIAPPGPVERVWSGLFVPDAANGSLEFTLSAGSSGLWPAMVAVGDNVQTFPVAGNAAYTFGDPITIVIPAPAAAVLLGFACGFVLPRRRPENPG